MGGSVSGTQPAPDKSCQLNRSMQQPERTGMKYYQSELDLK
jgi:hypothetical protein